MPLLFLSHVLYSALIDWIIFNGNLIGFFEFHIAHSEILLAACADQLLYNLSLINLYSACVKQNTAVNAASDTCSLFNRHYLI